MNILRKGLQIVFLLSVISMSSCQKNDTVVDDCSLEGNSEPIGSISLDNINFNSDNCPFGNSRAGSHWIIQSTSEYESWKQNIDCESVDSFPEIDFDKYTLLFCSVGMSISTCLSLSKPPVCSICIAFIEFFFVFNEL